MLDPHGRTLLFDILKPPEGHVLDQAIATTYTLDLLALLTAPVAFSLFDVDDHRELLSQDSLTLFESLRRYAERLTVFCNAGMISLPKAKFPQFEFLEGSVVQCLPRRLGAAFHAKMWVLRFVQASGPGVTYRLACLSRNLTFDRCWDTALVLDGPLLDRQRAIASNHPLGEFVRSLPEFTGDPLPVRIADRIAMFESEVRRVDFAAPEGFETIQFHNIYPGSRFPLDDRPGKLLVISPFVSDGGLKKLTAQRHGTILVSRPESLQQPGCAFPGVDRFLVLAKATDEVEDGQSADSPVDLTRGLHAKCYVIDAGWKAHVFTGSANATDAAFSGNIEFLVELVGPRTKFGIDALFRREEGKTCLGDLLDDFTPNPAPVDDVGEGIRAAIERTRWVLTTARFQAVVTQDGEQFSLHLRSTSTERLEPGVSVSCWPVTLGRGWGMQLRAGASEVSFERLSFEAITSFIAFEVSVGEPAKIETFVLNVPLIGAPTDRRDRLLRSFIQDRQRLVRFLLFLLADDSELADAMGSAARGGPGDGAGDAARGNGALLESLLRTLHRSPERLDAVARLVEDVKRQPDAQELLPPDFAQIWDAIWAVKTGAAQ